MTFYVQQSAVFSANYPTPADLPPVLMKDPSLPLISIVTPSYNQGEFIRQTIESVVTQDYPNTEYWVIDGGSTDETVSILRQYEHDPRFHWISEKDKGQSDAVNKGLARCQGDIFNWLGSDDMLLPGSLDRVAHAWMLSPQLSVIYGWARLIDQDGNDLGYGPRQSSNVTLEKMLRSQSFPMQQATFVPLEAIRALGGINASLDYAMDLDLWIKLIEKLPFRHIPFDLALYRLHRASKTMSLSVKFIDDVALVLRQAADRNLLSKSQAICYSDLFAAQVYLTPEAKDFRAALQRLVSSIKEDPFISPAAAFILLKGIARLVVGERYWSKVRLVSSKFR